jgi:hypothetical protein
VAYRTATRPDEWGLRLIISGRIHQWASIDRNSSRQGGVIIAEYIEYYLRIDESNSELGMVNGERRRRNAPANQQKIRIDKNLS